MYVHVHVSRQEVQGSGEVSSAPDKAVIEDVESKADQEDTSEHSSNANKPEDAEDEEVKSKESSIPFKSERFILPTCVTEKMCMLLSETLKIMFSQTVNWKNGDDYEEVSMTSY